MARSNSAPYHDHHAQGRSRFGPRRLELEEHYRAKTAQQSASSTVSTRSSACHDVSCSRSSRQLAMFHFRGMDDSQTSANLRNKENKHERTSHVERFESLDHFTLFCMGHLHNGNCESRMAFAPPARGYLSLSLPDLFTFSYLSDSNFRDACPNFLSSLAWSRLNHDSILQGLLRFIFSKPNPSRL